MFKSAFKRIVCFILCILLVVCGFPLNAFAEQENVEFTLETYLSSSPESRMVANYQALADSINEQLKNFEPIINIYDFKITATEKNYQLIVNILTGGLPECFHIDLSFQISISGTYIYAIIPNYMYTQDEYNQMLAECEAAADKMLEGIEGNNKLSDVEKLLILHDRIAVSCEYDYERYLMGQVPHISHTIYGVFVNKVAVCQGYALTYDYLLDRIGIENYYCDSRDLVHAWNIVYVDGKPYHVDITYNDQIWDITGRITHDCFLVSTDELRKNGHDAYDFDASPTDTTYDNYFWQNSDTAFTLLNDEVYYIDNKNSCIMRHSDNSVIYNINCRWKANATQDYLGNFSRLSTDGKDLLFSQSDGIYKLNFQKGKAELVHKADLNGFFSVYGFTFDDGMLIYDLSTSPFFNSDTKKLYEYKVPYVPKEDLPYIPGDIDDDGDVSLTDIVIMAQYIAEWDVVCNEAALDVNGDETVTLQDVTHLAQYVAGWEGIELN